MFGAIASIAGGLLGASSSKKAAKAQSDASRYAADVEKEMFETSRADMAPWRNVGVNALYGLADLWGLNYKGSPQQGTPGSTVVTGSYGTGLDDQGRTYNQALADYDAAVKDYEEKKAFQDRWGDYFERSTAFGDRDRSLKAPDPFVFRPATAQTTEQVGGTPGMSYKEQQDRAMGKFFTSPNYQWRQDEQQRAVENSALARGTGKSGATQKELARQSGAMASGEFWNYVNQLNSMAGTGQNTATQMATQSGQAARGIGANMTAAGQARASGYTGQSDAIQNAIGNFYYSQQRPGSIFGGGSTPPQMTQPQGPTQANWNSFSF